MASSPALKVYDSAGKYQASCHEHEAAAVLVSFYGEGSTIRYRHGLIVWTEGKDGSAGESYDRVFNVIFERVNPPKSTEFNETRWLPNA